MKISLYRGRLIISSENRNIKQGERLSRISSGIPGLDTILNGGFVKGGVYLLLGPPGAGKTIFANQMCFHHARSKSGNIVYVTLLAESHGRMMENLRPLKYYEEEDVSESIHYMGGYHVLEKEGLKGFLRLIAGIVKEKNASILMIDGMSTIGELEQSAITFRKFAHELNSYLSSSGCTAFLLSSMEGHLSKPEHTMVDGIISFHYENINTRVSRQIEIRKFRGSGHFYGKHLYTINDEGITIYPKLESMSVSSDFPANSRKRVNFNIKGLDEMFNGGIFNQTLMSIVGSAGTGKTSVGLKFLEAGAEANENGVFFGLYERPSEIYEKAKAISIDLEKENIEVVWFPALELELDELGYKLLETVRRTKAKRVVIDGLDGFRNSVLYQDRIYRFMTALVLELKRLGATTLIIEELPTFGGNAGRQLAELSAINEAVLLFQHENVENEVLTAISIIKMRNSRFSKHTQHLIISDSGIQVTGTLSSQGALSGKARK